MAKRLEKGGVQKSAVILKGSTYEAIADSLNLNDSTPQEHVEQNKGFIEDVKGTRGKFLNDTGSTLYMGDIVSVTDLMLNDDTKVAYFANNAIESGTYSAGDHFGIVSSKRKVDDQTVGQLTLDGYAYININVTDITHTAATLDAGQLESKFGNGIVNFIQVPTGTGVQTLLCRINQVRPEGGVVRATLVGTMADTDTTHTIDVSPTDNESNIGGLNGQYTASNHLGLSGISGLEVMVSTDALGQEITIISKAVADPVSKSNIVAGTLQSTMATGDTTATITVTESDHPSVSNGSSLTVKNWTKQEGASGANVVAAAFGDLTSAYIIEIECP